LALLDLSPAAVGGVAASGVHLAINHNGQVLSASIVSYLVGKIQDLPGGLVYGLVALLVFAEAGLFVGFVLPGETAVIVAGVVASRGHVNVVTLCVVVVFAAIAGDSAGYAFGARYGERLFTLPILRTRRAALERALEGLRRRGPIYVFVGRFTAFLRAIVPGLAGMSPLSYRRFFIANASGALIWGVAYTLLGYFAGTALDSIERYSGWAGGAILVVVVAFIVGAHFAKKRGEAILEASLQRDPPEDSAQGGE
jgi:membrane protein DedA with SNARE-associated domain